MKIAADTNVLVRAITNDHPTQSPAAMAMLADSESVALPLTALCELAWVLWRGYRTPRPEIATAIRRLLHSANVVADRPAVAAGLAMLDAGGDFADGVIAYEGRWLGADAFASFDREAVSLLKASGASAVLLG